MKENLKKIFQDISRGKLTQTEALEQIKAIKLQEQGKATGTKLSSPIWKAGMPSPADQVEYAQRHIILCELPEVSGKALETALPGSQVLTLQATSQTNIAAKYESHALACFEHIKQVLSGKPQGKILIQLVIGGEAEHAVFAGLSALLKTAGLENPKVTGQVIITQSGVKAEQLAAQLKENQSTPHDQIIKYEQSTRHILKSEEVEAGEISPKVVFKDQGVYLITGGMGGLGILFAKEILKQTTRSRIILTGRNPLTAERKKVLEALPALKNKVEYHQLDLNNADQVGKLIAKINGEGKLLCGIIHCAGMTADNFIIKKSGKEFSKVLAPKVAGTFNLDEASKDLDLDFIVLFSSVASLLGNVGQADYAAANGFMDQFAVYRNQLVNAGQRQGHTLSINWPLWQEGGMQIDQANQEILKETMDVQPLETSAGMHAFYCSLELAQDQVLVARGRMPQQLNGDKEAGSNVEKHSATTQLTTNTGDLFEQTEQYLCQEFSSLLKLASHKIDPQAPLENYGIDSILAMKFTGQLEKTFGSLSKTLFFEYQTIRELTEYFVKSHAVQLAAIFNTATDNAEKPVEARSQPEKQMPQKLTSGKRFTRPRPLADQTKSARPVNDDPIAIVGLSGRYPEAANIEAFWDNLRDGKDCIIEVPKERWDWREYYSEDRTKSGYHYSKWGGFIEGVDEFDPRFFNIAPREAAAIDPQERLFLQHAYMAVEDAGYTRTSLQIPHNKGLAGQVGVYAGVMYGEYNLSGSLASIANRVSYVLNLHGPSITLDTMCSSSLTAIHLACQDLKAGLTDLAIAGGVNVSVHPSKYLMLSTGQFISSDGHCQSFGEGGDGYIPGEGVGAVVLKRLSEAKKDGNHIYGIIRGSSLNHGGKTNGYSVPNPKAQADVISHALAEAGVNPRHISYIEAHGTGTKLGDPIEISALTKAFHQNDQDTAYCQLGSAKSNIGHCESAAGIAGLTKILLQMKHRKIVPSLHSTHLNPHIDFDKTPFIVNQTLKDWEQPVVDGKALPRIAGISSFGAGGANAHIIIQEYTEAERPVSLNGETKDIIIPVSARTAGQLKQKAQDLLKFIRTSASQNLPSIACTLQTGREAMDERLAFAVTSISQLEEKLQAYVDDKSVDGLYQGQVKRDAAYDAGMQQKVGEWIAGKQWPQLMEAWVKGTEVDWNKLYSNTKPKLVSLPVYPFARERYWKDINTTVQAPNRLAAVALHPLLHRNISNLNEQAYSSTFSGDEFFITGQQVLPEAAYLEMARVAISQAMPVQEEPYILEMHNTVWAGPAKIAEGKPVNIALLAQTQETVNFEIYSPEAKEDIIYCQGQAVISKEAAPSKLDITQLRRQLNGAQRASADVYAAFGSMGLAYSPAYQSIAVIEQGNGQLLASLSLPDDLEETQKDFQLHPAFVEGALQAGMALMTDFNQPSSGALLPGSIDTLRVIGHCTGEMLAWVRYAEDSAKADIDLCDAQGNICVQMLGVRYQEEAVTPVSVEQQQTVEKQMVAKASTSAPEPVQTAPKQIQITPLAGKPSSGEPVFQKFAQVVLEKPTNVSLVKPQAISAKDINQPVPGKGSVTLAATTSSSRQQQNGKATTANFVKLFDHGNGLYSIDIDALTNYNTLSHDLVEQVLKAVDFVKKISSVKVLMLRGTSAVFLHGGREEYNDAISQKLYQAIASFPYPVIAVMQGGATGAGFLVGALCDFMVCSQESKYSYTDHEEGLFPTAHEEILFKERFGEALASDFLYQSTVLTGKELKAKGWSCPVLPTDQVEAYATELASDLIAKSQTALSLLKQHLGRHIQALVEQLTTVEPVGGEGKITKKHKLTSASKLLKLEDSAEHVLIIRIKKSRKKDKLKDVASGLEEIFTQVKKGAHYKTILLASEDPGYLTASGKTNMAEDVLAIQKLLIEAPVPVVAAVESEAKGPAWLIAQSCDACVYSEEGAYSLENILQIPKLAKQAALIFANRLGNYASKELLLAGKTYSGAELMQLSGAVAISKTEEVLTRALALAGTWAGLSLASVTTWKKERAAALVKEISQLPGWPDVEEKPSKALSESPVALDLKSEVIKATVHPEGVVEVKMEDREAKNMFSEAFIEGMKEIFAHIDQSEDYKAVVFTGYDSYFASGGTKESLLAIQEGKAKFTDTTIFQLAMECKVPVIAAMQGHAIGAGWSMGMFADFMLLSEESHYVSPYMNYGFTPGAAATLIFPDKTGYDLSRDTLLTANEYSGDDLKRKGLILPVLSRKDIHEAALTLAKQIAQNPRSGLVAAKLQLTRHLKALLEETYSRELAMHEKTFVGQEDTLKQIESNFYSAERTAPVQAVPVKENAVIHEPQATSQNQDALPGIISSLKKLLAKELHLEVDEIDENSQFVDLGLDSIVGVTFIRKINDKYGTSLQATVVYSYSTLAKLAGHVKEEAEKLGTIVSPPVAQEVQETAPVQTPQNIQPAANTSSVSDALPGIISTLKKLLAKELHLEIDEIDENSQFVDLGLDSIVGVTFIRKINDKYGTSLQATIVYSHSTIAKLSEHVKEEAEKQGTLVAAPVAPTATAVPVNTPAEAPKQVPSMPVIRKKLTSWRNKSALRTSQATKSAYQSQPIAVIGMAGQFPEAKNIEAFWQNIAEGKNCISEISPKRWSMEGFFKEGEAVPGKSYSKWMGSLEEFDLFDPLFFNISPSEAESMDPQQRLFLQACWHTIENAGYDPQALSGSKCGVFVGCAAGDYLQQSKQHQLSAQGFTGAASSILAARISYFLNLQGPCISIDTACSSSLVAIANACDSLISGSSNVALAGGVYVMATPSMHIMSSQSGMLSPDGRCYTFDQRANGFVPGEGVGAVMLKRLEDAERDDDNILGVIHGWGVNQDGKTNGITAPNTESQTLLEQQVYDQFNIDPTSIQLIEAHGTGTKLGDPIEVEGLRRSFKKYTQEQEYCALGSVKSNIGHCLTAAGVAGTIKVLMAMKHRQLPPTINYTQLNEHISLKDSPFYVNTQLKDWSVKSTERRQAAISAFGFSGTNAHIVMGEYIPQTTTTRPVQVVTQNSEQMIPLSAKSEEQLRQKAIDLIEYIGKAPETVDITALAYTLQVGREAMDHRLGLMAANVNQLTERLQTWLDNEDDPENIYQGHIKRSKEGISIISNDADMKETIIGKYIGKKKLSKLMELWVKGLDLDWHKLYGELKPKRISLPLYPFAKERYWIEETAEKQAHATGKVAGMLHPLLHRNTSDLHQQSYSTTFTREETLVSENQVSGHKVIPAMAYLEMTRAAVLLADSPADQSAVTELNNISWNRPIVVADSKEVGVALFVADMKGSREELIDVELYSEENGEEITYFQAQARYSYQAENTRLELTKLKGQMSQAAASPKDIYTGLFDMGFAYGRGYQAITAIYPGEDQLLAELRLPPSGENNQDKFMLHPAIIEGVLQACISLVADKGGVEQPLFPATLDTLRIVLACTGEMTVWVRTQGQGSAAKLDIDLMDQEGNICVEMRGLTLQDFAADEAAAKITETGKAIPSHAEEASQPLFFTEHWEDKPLASNGVQPENRQVIIFADEVLQKQLTTGDDAVLWASAVFVRQGKKFGQVAGNIYECRFNHASDIQKVLSEVNDKSNTPISLVYTWAKGQKEAGIHALFSLFKAIKIFNQPVKVILTGHYDPSIADSCWDYSWIGFERSLKLVLPHVKVALLYTDAQTFTPQQLIDAIHHPGITWYRGQSRLALSIKSTERIVKDQQPVLKKHGGYLITGGSGKLGYSFAQYLAKEYQAKLILMGRSPLTSGIEEQIEELKKAGAKEVYYNAVDISDEKALAAWEKNLPFDLSGVIHAAGVEGTQMFHEKTTKSINEVLQPKSTGTILIDGALQQHPLSFVCYFSSSAALLGDFGSCDYAIANRFQMAYAQHRWQNEQAKGKTVVINWPFWKDGGMGKGDAEQAAFYLKSSGQDVLETAEGLEIWHDIIRTGETQTLVLKGKPNRLEQFLNRIYTAEEQTIAAASQAENLPTHMGKGWKVQYQDLSIKECIYADLTRLVSASLKIPAAKLDGVTNLADYGFDSISLTTFAKQLKEYFSLEITPALFYNYATIEKLSSYFMDEHQIHMQEFYRKPQSEVSDTQKQTPVIQPVVNRTSLRKRFLQSSVNGRSYTARLEQEPIAIVGMSGRFPKADTVDQLWSLLEKGESGVSEIPLSRWDWRDYFTAPGHSGNKISTNKGGFINNIDEFDPLFFEITPREAEATDPGQRMLLMEAYKAIEDAQINPSSLRGTPVGVFVGMEESQYDALIADEQGVGNSGNAMISSRLSYFLDLHGPTIATNTACSSGLVALHQAVTSLRNGECESALVAGISSLILSPKFYEKMSQAGMLSQDGQCFSFAKKANGIGASEAVVVLMLKPLSAAIEDGNPIYGTIKASGINFDGKTNGVTAPNGKSQEELIKRVYTNHNINPQDISHIIAHGTGTKLGDPIEINALNDAFKKLSNGQARSGKCAITSCKSNLGHTMAASGLVSVVSMLKGLQHNKIPATINCEDENDYISWKDSPFYINKTTKKWDRADDRPRMGGISSFGRSGTNAHVVVEEYVPQQPVQPVVATHPGDGTQVIIALSAKSDEQLHQKAGDLLDFISTKKQDIDLLALAYSLQVTREAMEVRLGLIVGSVEELKDKLQAYRNAEKGIEGVYQGEVKHNDTSVSIFNVDADLQETIEKWITHKKLSKLLELWVKGLELDWNKLYGEVKPQRISLPKYPFAKERYWVKKTTSRQIVESKPASGSDNFEIIEDLINQIESESIETDEAVSLLKNIAYTK
ncbi:SDR family NAD(P)-dependent oxidoreductase [Fulvivirga ulvae]|uniref:SDR family NAD(P)-dependent oxidoreductase n=1 Tax=Fulvivirga ulvae TaxID=2904245 RepID=UPI001F3BB8E9|nr:SDR family NAD(P)-dependent oxidoreductase [Fulvivirga ulvae]UII31929.1 SDR family NAD(P)-dependent oxidoreductase [Fulvivirga ulvae]